MIRINEKDKTKIRDLKYIDLFCGIGGFRLALDSFDAECVFSSEIDKSACKVYQNNYNVTPRGDIRAIGECDVPPHDILCAGFPCQAFSISGKQRGFNDERGSLFFEIVRIARHHKPKLLLLENVANFARHDAGKTLGIVLENLKKIGYDVYYQILNASDYSVPQKRERIYSENGVAITLSAYGGGVGAKTGLYLINGRVRKLSPRECARLQGFPDSFIMDDSPSQSYKQFGNSIAIDVVQKILIEVNRVI